MKPAIITYEIRVEGLSYQILLMGFERPSPDYISAVLRRRGIDDLLTRFRVYESKRVGVAPRGKRPGERGVYRERQIEIVKEKQELTERWCREESESTFERRSKAQATRRWREREEARKVRMRELLKEKWEHQDREKLQREFKQAEVRYSTNGVSGQVQHPAAGSGSIEEDQNQARATGDNNRVQEGDGGVT